MRWHGFYFQENSGGCFREFLGPKFPLEVVSRGGLQIGNSLFDGPGSEKVKGLVEKAKERGVKLVFPVDYITADKFDANAEVGPLRRLYDSRVAKLL